MWSLTTYSTVGCDVTLFDDLAVGTVMVDHNTTASPRQASTTSSIDKEFVPDSFCAAEALTAMVVVPSNVNADAPTTCSTKCQSVIIDITASTEVCAVVKELATIPPRAAAMPADVTAIPSNINTNTTAICSMKCPSLGIDILHLWCSTPSLRRSLWYHSTLLLLQQRVTPPLALMPWPSASSPPRTFQHQEKTCWPHS
ncbi:hypothetical protein PR202_ga04338 [Eleusine coracana subsp. coracana]|uniref:Uncharacterized protein n=1 Tax=Eleusine coracana subsp. coracana TaxID=191504 RepID=A0AAV5BRQ7_ELECO|nr:hypothetical protein PR202_ga04338 [Eleusine coracana subsp. coracana]